MVEHPSKHQFLEEVGGEMNLPAAIAKARTALAAISDAPLDSVRSCEKQEGSQWVAALVVIESPARLGDNDLLSAYEIKMNATGELLSYRRIGRYFREEAPSS